MKYLVIAFLNIGVALAYYFTVTFGEFPTLISRPQTTMQFMLAFGLSLYSYLSFKGIVWILKK